MAQIKAKWDMWSDIQSTNHFSLSFITAFSNLYQATGNKWSGSNLQKPGVPINTSVNEIFSLKLWDSNQIGWDEKPNMYSVTNQELCVLVRGNVHAYLTVAAFSRLLCSALKRFKITEETQSLMRENLGWKEWVA